MASSKRPYRLVGLGHRPFTAITRVRIPLGTPFLHSFPSQVLRSTIAAEASFDHSFPGLKMVPHSTYLTLILVESHSPLERDTPARAVHPPADAAIVLVSDVGEIDE